MTSPSDRLIDTLLSNQVKRNTRLLQDAQLIRQWRDEDKAKGRSWQS